MVRHGAAAGNDSRHAPGRTFRQEFQGDPDFDARPSGEKTAAVDLKLMRELDLHMTLGESAFSLGDFFRDLRTEVNRGVKAEPIAIQAFRSAREFAHQLSERFPVPGSTDPLAVEAAQVHREVVESHATLAYMQAAAALLGNYDNFHTFSKNYSLVALRDSLAQVRANLPQPVQDFFRANTDQIAQAFESRLRQDNPQWIRDFQQNTKKPLPAPGKLLLLKAGRGEGYPIRTYLEQALRPLAPGEKEISPNDMLGIRTDFRKLDDAFAPGPI